MSRRPDIQLEPFNPEIERQCRALNKERTERIRKEKEERRRAQQELAEIEAAHTEDELDLNQDELDLEQGVQNNQEEQNKNQKIEEIEMGARQPMMKEFARPIIGTATSCIRLEEAARNYELKNIHYSMLPSFYGIPNEDPLNFIRDFYSTIQTFPLQGLTEDQLRMRCFPYTLKDKAKAWYMTLAPNSLTTWEEVYNRFMGKFYSHQKTAELRTKIATFTQIEGEPFHEAWERFKMLLIQCLHHHYPLQLLNQFFYDGLTQQCQYTVDNAAGGAMGEKTAEDTQELFEMLGANSQQKSVRGRRAGVHEVNTNQEMAMQIAELTKQVKLLAAGGSRNVPNQEVCGICGIFGHGANVCSAVFDSCADEEEQVNALEGFQPRVRNDPFSNTYNPGWRNHPNFSWKNNNQQQQPQPQYQLYQRTNQFQGQSSNQNQPRKPSLEDSLNAFIQVSEQNQVANNQRLDSLEASMKRMETQVGQLANQMQIHQKGKLPSQPEQAKSITVLRSGKVIDNKVGEPITNGMFNDADDKEADSEQGEKETSTKEEVHTPELHRTTNPYRPPIPYPSRLKNDKQDKQFSDLYNMLSKVNINLPLLDVIRNVPAYVKFFKELSTKKRRFEANEKVLVSEVASAVLQQQLPPKQKDPGSFVVNISMGNGEEVKGMLDLGAGINLMPYCIYKQLGLGKLKPTRICLQLADRSIRYPVGIIEDILVKVGG